MAQKALFTFGVGNHTRMLEVSKPSMQAFADKHGYDFFDSPLSYSDERPPSWWKLPSFVTLFERGYDHVLWIDCDMVIIRDDKDIDVPDDAWQAMVEHHTKDGYVPGCGFWLVRPTMYDTIVDVHRRPGDIHNPWWEQRAMSVRLGYTGNSVLKRPREPNELLQHTHFLSPEWSLHKHELEQPEKPRVLHASMYPNRLEVMKKWAAQALAPMT